MSRDYSDIINLPHHVSDKRPHMSLYDRAAQFAPFAALTGHEEQIEQASEENALKLLYEYTDPNDETDSLSSINSSRDAYD